MPVVAQGFRGAARGGSELGPTVVAVVGQQVAVIAVFSTVGAVETGRFYVAMMIAGFVAGVAVSLQNVMLPYLSGLADGRKRAAWRVFRVSMTLVAPLAAAVLVAPDGVLGLLGRGFSEAWPLLAALFMAFLAAVPTSAVINLCYAYHRYRDVFWIGWAPACPASFSTWLWRRSSALWASRWRSRWVVLWGCSWRRGGWGGGLPN